MELGRRNINQAVLAARALDQKRVWFYRAGCYHFVLLSCRRETCSEKAAMKDGLLGNSVQVELRFGVDVPPRASKGAFLR